MVEKVLTNSAGEKITVRWDGERFALVHYLKYLDTTEAIILNPREMLDLIKFAGTLGGD